MVPLPCVALKKPGEWRHKTRDKAASEAFCLCCNSSSCFLWWHLFSHFLILHYWEGLTFYGIAGNVEPSSPLHSAGSAILLGVSSWQGHLRGWWMSVLGGVRYLFCSWYRVPAWDQNIRWCVNAWSTLWWGPGFCHHWSAVLSSRHLAPAVVACRSS